jgi:hypothetical protein
MATITDLAIERKAYRMFGDTSANFQYCALGSGETAEANDATALAAEHDASGCARMIADSMSVESATKAVWVATWTASADAAINETGLFDAPAAGTMLMRHKFSATKNLGNGDTLTLTYKETQSRA